MSETNSKSSRVGTARLPEMLFRLAECRFYSNNREIFKRHELTNGQCLPHQPVGNVRGPPNRIREKKHFLGRIVGRNLHLAVHVVIDM